MLKQSQNLHKVAASEQTTTQTGEQDNCTHTNGRTHTHLHAAAAKALLWLAAWRPFCSRRFTLSACVCAGGSPRAQKIRIMFSTKNALTNWGHARVRSGTAQLLEVWASFFPFTLITFARDVQPPQPLQHTHTHTHLRVTIVVKCRGRGSSAFWQIIVFILI